MLLRFTLSITLLIFGLPNEATLKAETPAQVCKSTVTGTLEMIPLESRCLATSVSCACGCRPATPSQLQPRSGIPCSTSLMGRCFLTVAHPSRFQMSGVWTKP